MNDLTTAAVERLTAQLGEALFGEPGLSLMEIANRRGEIEALVKDAERYRWLRDRAPDEWGVWRWVDSDSQLLVDDSLMDSEIDAAMTEQAE